MTDVIDFICSLHTSVVKPTCGLRHASLSDVFAPWDPTTFRAGLLPVFVAPFPVWVRLKVGLFYLGQEGESENLTEVDYITHDQQIAFDAFEFCQFCEAFSLQMHLCTWKARS